MNAKMGRSETGRQYPRSRTYECHSCHQRNAIGTPRASESWPAKLRLSERQIDTLLIAAAEFRDLSEEAGMESDPIAFLDWVRPDALGLVNNLKVEPPVLTLVEKRRRQGVA